MFFLHKILQFLYNDKKIKNKDERREEYSYMIDNIPSPQERFNAIIKECLAPLMKKYGFKKKGTKFTREDEDLIYIIKTYKSRWNTKEELVFRIEWALEIKEEKKKPEVAFKAEALYGDLYDFTKDAKLQWFHLKENEPDSLSNDNNIKEKIVFNLESKVLPFIFSLHHIQDIIKIIETTTSQHVLWSMPVLGGQTLSCLSRLYYFIEQPQKSIELIDKAIQNAKIASYRKGLEDTRQNFMNGMKKKQ